MTLARKATYGSPMSVRASPLALFRALPKMERVDVVLAALLTVMALLQTAFLPGLDHRFWIAVIYTPICVGVAFRRRHPAVVGFGTQALLSATYEHVHAPAGAVTVASFCSLYALAIWWRTRTFVAALVFVVLANGGPGLLHPASAGAGAQFGVV